MELEPLAGIEPALSSLPRRCFTTKLQRHRALELGRILRGRIDHLADFGDFRRRKATHLRVLVDEAFVFGEIDAERLVVGDVTLEPLDVGRELVENGI